MDTLHLQHYTIKDIYALPEGKRAELIGGQIYDMVPPNLIHQEILMYISNHIANYIHEKKGPCKVYPAPIAVFLNGDDSEYFEPDISVICDPNKLDQKKGCMGAPDWIIEITSPGTASRDYVLKLNKYMDAGVREYWIVDPRNETITVHHFDAEEYIPSYHTFADKVKVNIYDDLAVDFGDLDL